MASSVTFETNSNQNSPLGGGAVRLSDISSSSFRRHLLPQNVDQSSVFEHANTFVDNGVLHLQPVTPQTDGIYLCELLPLINVGSYQQKLYSNNNPVLLRTLHITTVQPQVGLSALRVGVTFAVIAWNTTSPHQHRHRHRSSWLTHRHRISQIAQLNYRLLLPHTNNNRRQLHDKVWWQIERQMSGIQVDVLHAHERSVTLRDLLPDAEYEVCVLYRKKLPRHRHRESDRRLSCTIIHTQSENYSDVITSSLTTHLHADLLHFVLILALLLTFVLAVFVCTYRFVFGLRRYSRQKLKIFPVEDEALLSSYRTNFPLDQSSQQRYFHSKRTKRLESKHSLQDEDDDEFWVVTTGDHAAQQQQKLDNYRRRRQRRRSKTKPVQLERQRSHDQTARRNASESDQTQYLPNAKIILTI